MRKLIMTALLLLVSLTACGFADSGDGVASAGGTSSPSNAPAPQPDDDSGLKYAQCMRENGVDLPDPEPGTLPLVVDGAPDSKEHKALAACKKFLPNGGETDKKISPEDLEKVRQYAQCMREHGVDMPDPDPDGGVTGGTTGDGDPAKITAADKVCQSKLPGRQG